MAEEQYIEQKLVNGVKKLRGLCIKLASPSMDGLPDRIVLVPWAKIYFVELKAPNGRLSKIQIVVHTLFKACGFPVRVLWSAKHVADFLEEIK